MLRKPVIFLIVVTCIFSLIDTEWIKSEPKAGKNTSNLSMAEGFADPPVSSRPYAYWAWLNGNVSLPRLTEEIQEMLDKGLGGYDIFDVGTWTAEGKIPDGPTFMGPESMKAIAYAIREATRLGLELGFITSSSWNAGGTWVKPEQANNALFNSELAVKGPMHFKQRLPFPAVPEKTPKGRYGEPLFYKDIAVLAYPKIEDNVIKNPSDIINLTGRMGEKGELNWEVPEGEWMISRFVCANTGKELVIPGVNSNGLIIDHFDPEPTRMHFQYMIDKLLEELGTFENTALKYLYLCSYEVWKISYTPKFQQEFLKRRGYDMTPYLPVLTGLTVKNKEVSERFKYDYDKTICDLIVDYHYRLATDISNKYGLQLCAESGGPGNIPVEALKALGALDIPRGEFWYKYHIWLIKEIACAAHIYGKKIVDQEAFTSWLHWQEGPGDLKPLADLAFCEGMNKVTFHTSPHNPHMAGKPGWVYIAGTHIDPNRVWWHKTKPFMDYLGRCCHMLREGLFVGDVCYYYGDQGFNFVPTKHVDPSLGYGYDYDVTNAEVILTRMSVKDGRIVLPDGMSYELLVLPEREDMDLDVLRKLEELVKSGATVVGSKPIRTNGLRDYPNRDEIVGKLADKIWGPCDGKRVKERKYGKGRIICGRKLRDILNERGIGPDFSFNSSSNETELDYIHRQTENEDIYFVINKNKTWETVDCAFRVKDKIPELWMPDTGEMRKNPVYDSVKDGTRVLLQLPPEGSVFVIFREKASNRRIVSISKDGKEVFPVNPNAPAEYGAIEILQNKGSGIKSLIWKEGKYILKNGTGSDRRITADDIPADISISGEWEVGFPSGWGAPESKVFPNLYSWTEDSDFGIKHFSGIATYNKEFDVPAELINKDNCIKLDLGKIWVLADVYLNGKHLGIVWKSPFILDITDALKPGKNKLVVEVANTWSNRIVGDTKVPPIERFTRTNIKGSEVHPRDRVKPVLWKDTPLLESGLMGPVKLIFGKKIKLDL